LIRVIQQLKLLQHRHASDKKEEAVILKSFLNHCFPTNFNYLNRTGKKSPGLQGITAETIGEQVPFQHSSYKSQVISSL